MHPDEVGGLLGSWPSDRMPVQLFAAQWSVARAGLPPAAVHDDPSQSLLAQLRAQELLGHNSPPYYAYATYGTWEGGGDLAYPSSELRQRPTQPYYPVQAEQDVEALVMPDVTTAGMLPWAMRFSEIQKELGLPISVVVGGAFTIAGNICGLGKLLRWMMTSPGSVHRIVQRAGGHVVEIIELWVETFGAERIIPHIWESLPSNQIMSPRHFEEFVLPYQKELHERILGAGIKHILCHICGEQSCNLEHWGKVPMGDPGIVSIGHEIDLGEASRCFAGDILMGNVDPGILQGGTPQQIDTATSQCMAVGRKHPGGFALASGCEIGPMAPAAGLKQIVESALE